MKRYRVRHSSVEHGTSPPWAGAELLTDFTFPWEETAPPTTEFRALWNEERFHFRFDCVDHDFVFGEGDTAGQRALDSDRVEIFLTPELSLNPYYGFEMSPRGDLLVYRARTYRQFEREWRCEGFEFSGRVEDRGYTVEGSISMNTLRRLGVLKPDARNFLAGVFRAEFSHNPDGTIHQGWMPWVNPQTDRPDFHVPSSFGVFELV